MFNLRGSGQISLFKHSGITMNINIIILIVLSTIVIGGFIFLIYAVNRCTSQRHRELSFAPGVYTGPAGDPWWDGKLPEKVEDYVVPRYVYENLVESTEFLPENGRIIGYRISPSLVIHSRVQKGINPPVVWSYIRRFNGKLLENEESSILCKNWQAISELRVKAGDTPLECDYFWGSYDGETVAYSSNGLSYKRSFTFSGAYETLILKR